MNENINGLNGDEERVDKELSRLFEEKMRISSRRAEKNIMHALRDDRRSCDAPAVSPELSAYYARFTRSLDEITEDYRASLMRGMRVAYGGVEGAFASVAARKLFQSASLIPCGDFEAAYRGVEDGSYDCAVLPIENSYAGEVGTVTDLMFSGSLYITEVLSLPIRHALVSKNGATVDGITEVISHPQALAQCANYIRSHGYITRDAGSTSEAARLVRDSERLDIAAIASEEAAREYGLSVISESVNDIPSNTTRFAVFSRLRNSLSSDEKHDGERFILLFTVENRAGALAQTLNIIGAHGYNMVSLRSRPMKDLQWNYYFYIEADGNIDTENGRALLRELSAVCARIRLVGSFTEK